MSMSSGVGPGAPAPTPEALLKRLQRMRLEVDLPAAAAAAPTAGGEGPRTPKREDMPRTPKRTAATPARVFDDFRTPDLSRMHGEPQSRRRHTLDCTPDLSRVYNQAHWTRTDRVIISGISDSPLYSPGQIGNDQEEEAPSSRPSDRLFANYQSLVVSPTLEAKLTSTSAAALDRPESHAAHAAHTGLKQTHSSRAVSDPQAVISVEAKAKYMLRAPAVHTKPVAVGLDGKHAKARSLSSISGLLGPTRSAPLPQPLTLPQPQPQPTIAAATGVEPANKSQTATHGLENMTSVTSTFPSSFTSASAATSTASLPMTHVRTGSQPPIDATAHRAYALTVASQPRTESAPLASTTASALQTLQRARALLPRDPQQTTSTASALSTAPFTANLPVLPRPITALSDENAAPTAAAGAEARPTEDNSSKLFQAKLEAALAADPSKFKSHQSVLANTPRSRPGSSAVGEL